MTIPTMLPASPEGYQVAAQRYEIMFKDGSTIGLHPVWQHGAPVALLRALRFGEMIFVFDLQHLVKGIAEELCKAHTRDVPGTVFYMLRQAFANAGEATAKIVEMPKAVAMVGKTQVPDKADWLSRKECPATSAFCQLNASASNGPGDPPSWLQASLARLNDLKALEEAAQRDVFNDSGNRRFWPVDMSNPDQPVAMVQWTPRLDVPINTSETQA